MVSWCCERQRQAPPSTARHLHAGHGRNPGAAGHAWCVLQGRFTTGRLWCKTFSLHVTCMVLAFSGISQSFCWLVAVLGGCAGSALACTDGIEVCLCPLV